MIANIHFLNFILKIFSCATISSCTKKCFYLNQTIDHIHLNLYCYLFPAAFPLFSLEVMYDH